MIEQLQKTLNLIQKDELFKRLEQSGYAFAVWRMPNEQGIQVIISLQDIKERSDFQLNELGTGFFINSFKNNHPVKPYYIPADIVLSNEEVSIDPTIKSSDLDRFMEDIEHATFEQDSSTKTADNVEAKDFESAVESAIDAIKEGMFEKVVLSRFKDVTLPPNFSSWAFYQKISATYRNAFVSLTFIPGHGQWIGATPELLLADDSQQFRTVALAGTKTLEENQNLSEIAWTQKEIEEQAFVSRYIINCFKKIRLREFHEHGPKTIQAGQLAHLKTEFIVDYAELSFENLSDQMLELLHPTSAVCGMPIENSKPWIERMENYDRAFYSGFLGPVNFNGTTQLFVNLRCMNIKGDNARFYAGAGITEDSVPSKELQETDMKMNVLMSML